VLCFSIGYQGRSIDNLCQELTRNQVTLVVDVRERAWSHRPEFRKGALARALAAVGIEYEHCRIAGNPFRPRNAQPANLTACKRRYASHLKKQPDVLETVESAVRRNRAALLCFEREKARCHRGVLLMELSRRNPALMICDL